jgi:fatty-acyl-CoA synthase
MAVYKAPRAVRFVPTLPKTGSGKIVKRALREQARAGSA